jgi:hypothetical protein
MNRLVRSTTLHGVQGGLSNDRKKGPRMNLLHEIGLHLSGLEQLKAMLDADRRPGIGETLVFA